MRITTLSLGKRRSAAQAEASRRNGAKSRGPATEAGKARSARNSIRHGLNSRTIVLTTPEDRAAHARLAAAVAEQYRPEGALEEHWVTRLVEAMWRQTRLEIIESRVLEAMILGEEAVGLPSLATVSRYRARIGRDLAEARRQLEALREERREARRRRLLREATPERLRRLADRLQQRASRNEPEAAGIPAAAAAVPPSCRNEPGPELARAGSGTARIPPPAPEGHAPGRTNRA